MLICKVLLLGGSVLAVDVCTDIRHRRRLPEKCCIIRTNELNLTYTFGVKMCVKTCEVRWHLISSKWKLFLFTQWKLAYLSPISL